MAYRGEDLDLRTPKSWGSGGREVVGNEQASWGARGGIYAGGRADPIWVDETVLACCNHAFELAQAHRAPEVRIEHLLNALTLNADASQVLEANGIRDAALRRESAAVIAAELPGIHSHGQVEPKRSDAIEDVLRMAAERAYPRRTPVTVEDLLAAMFEIKRDLPGLQMLYRNASSGVGRSNGGEARGNLRLEPLPHLAPGYGSPSRNGYDDESRARREYQAGNDAFLTSHPPARGHETAGTGVDEVQNSRIEALERALREFGNDLSEERQSLQSVIKELQRTTLAQGDDTVRFRDALTDRLGAVEHAMLKASDGVGQPPQMMVEKLSSIEHVIEKRLNDMSQAWGAVSERLSALEAAAKRPALADEISSKLNERIGRLETTFQLVLDRMVGVERHLDDGLSKASVDMTPVEERLSAMELTVIEALGSQPDADTISEKVSSALAEPLTGKLAAIETAVVNRSAETGRTVSFIGERLRAFDEAIGAQNNQASERFERLNSMVASYADKVEEAGAGHSRDLTELHEAIVKLNANQQTLANALEQWRLDNTGDLSVISNRLKTLEETSERRLPLVQRLSEQLSTIHSVIVRREEDKSYFRHWLFGTDEWYSASYDTERWRARKKAQALSSESDLRRVGQQLHRAGE